MSQIDFPDQNAAPRKGPSTLLREVLVGVVAATGTVIAIFALTSGFFDQMTGRVADFAQLYGQEAQKAEAATKELEARNAEIFSAIELSKVRLAETEEQTKTEVEKLRQLTETYERESRKLQAELTSLRTSLQAAQDEAEVALRGSNEAGIALEAVKKRIAQIDSQAADAPEALNQFQELVRTLQKLEDQGEKTISAIVESDVFQERFQQSLLPVSAVVAVDSPAGCPVGWREVEDARGRFILGANSNRTHGFAARPFRGVGGAELHTLTVDEMPLHNHNNGVFSRLLVADGRVTVIAADNGPANSEPNIGASGNAEIVSAGDNQPHNNMPPYIALYFCKKEG